ncbi:nicotinate (nicotinamide) nucleotide adenylyltransferase [Desulfovibrio ferrophilus]|uniref:Probable nicotinate-nucleotide adenylyltransferase n=1 Tax=Desulfovibrio ferrophilus TaxID=241368 RepID=A0A2Z6AUM3_9BACT|nr:nicotinate (nicotinamide) nucleotide adenylyltransferase [Desulfovibrio ferrophilus]BBD06934.1 probable nicotinate-nucleotide adenylyltransferase [Desulfovibrio ferrophilus]
MKVGLLGGCFNPVHNGHLRLALETGERLGLDRVELVPAAVPPHKSGDGMLPFGLRAELCEAAIAGVEMLRVNRLEGEREGPSYTVDTLRALTAQRLEDEFTFILGSEDLFVLPDWHQGVLIPGLVNLAVAGRRDGGLEAVRLFVEQTWAGAESLDDASWRLPQGRRLSFIPAGRLDISASDIRQRWIDGQSVRGLVPEAVERLMDEHGDEVRTVWES